MINQSKGDSGYSIIEILAAVAILSIVSTVLYALYTTSWENWAVGQKKTEVQQYLRFAMDTVVADLRNAKTDIDSVMLTSGTEGFKIIQSSRTVDYYLQGDRLYREVNDSVSNEVGRFFASMQLIRIRKGTYKVILTTAVQQVGLRGEVASIKLETSVFAPNVGE